MRHHSIKEIEKWFINRGLPHFIHEYSAREDVLTRALPYLLGIFAIELVFVGELSDNRSLLFNVVALSIAAAVFFLLWMLVNKFRGRSLFAKPDSVGLIEMLVFVFGPPAVLFSAGQQTSQAVFIFIANCLLLFFLYFGTSYGVIPIVRWAIGLTWRQISKVVGLLIRSLPLILLFSVLIFLTGEIWQMCDGNNSLFFGFSLAIIALTGAIFAIFKVPEQISELSRTQSEEIAEQLLSGTPAEKLQLSDTDDVPKLTNRQWGNVGLVVLFSEGIQGFFVSLLLFMFFVVFGLFSISVDTIEIWVGSAPDVLFSFGLFGHDVILTQELIRISLFVGVLSGLYFTVNSLTDENYRREFVESLLDEVRVAFAVRSAYYRQLEQDRRESLKTSSNQDS